MRLGCEGIRDSEDTIVNCRYNNVTECQITLQKRLYCTADKEELVRGEAQRRDGMLRRRHRRTYPWAQTFTAAADNQQAFVVTQCLVF